MSKGLARKCKAKKISFSEKLACLAVVLTGLESQSGFG
jgi:hypothetical protein